MSKISLARLAGGLLILSTQTAGGLALAHQGSNGSGGAHQASQGCSEVRVAAPVVPIANEPPGPDFEGNPCLTVQMVARLQGFPDAATFAEAGYPDLVGITWFGISGPKGMPKDVVEKLNKELVRIMALPQVQERLARDEITTEPLSAEQFAKLVTEETAKWTPIAKASGAQPE